ncbi:helix-turn-helix domain-containing protein [Streptomyces sp. NBC_01190]|uniref:PucR family transcriptional regulator n=1 Tax=Streptomyces sp. NBC_01190 TaxID=2903767 RepID=UPI00386345F7|nr:helix-turn-helix domain-containing protein [Streptomyces sp. NBC_01190]
MGTVPSRLAAYQRALNFRPLPDTGPCDALWAAMAAVPAVGPVEARNHASNRPPAGGPAATPGRTAGRALVGGAATTESSPPPAFYDALLRAAASGDAEEGILRTLYDGTGLPALTEDPFGNPRARAGPGAPDGTHERAGAAAPHKGYSGSEVYKAYENHDRCDGERGRLLQSARRRSRAVRDRDRLIAPVEMAGDLVGLVALVDPDRRAGPQDMAALEHAALALAPGLAHQRGLAALQPRLRHDLVERLISGGGAHGDQGNHADLGEFGDLCAHAAALGHDLRRPHRVAVLQWSGPTERARLCDTVPRVAGRLRLDVLVSTRGETTVALVAGADLPTAGERLHTALAAELRTGAGAIGIGGQCDLPTGLPHSYAEAVRALTVRRRSHDPAGSTSFEELGLYRMMGTGDGQREADTFVAEWLGPLLDYDARHHTELVTTLSRYLESGGSYDTTSETLLIHRSTVRYRLQRIREITGHDLGDVETRLNLHVATRIRNVLVDPR